MTELKKSKVIIINTTNPELGHLAGYLAPRGLVKYICPYINLSRGWERFLRESPFTGKFYDASFGRRNAPAGLTIENTAGIGMWRDIAIAGIRRLNFPKWKIVESFAVFLQFSRERSIERTAYKLTLRHPSAVIISNYSVALESFKQTKALKILNFPFVEERYYEKVLVRERTQNPKFSQLLPERPSISKRLTLRKNMEVDLADLILVGSQFAKQTFIDAKVPASKIVVCPYGVNVELFFPPVRSYPPRSKIRLMFAGAISQRKGISYLLDAYKKVRTPDTELVLVGNIIKDGACLNAYRDLYHHIPNVPRKQLAELYREADIFVFPTLCEGLGLVVVEAMASGLPVITTSAGPDEIVRNGFDGLVVGPGDIDSLAGAISTLISDSELRGRMGKNARERASVFTWERYQQQLETLIADRS